MADAKTIEAGERKIESLPDQLKKAFDSGTTARNGVKAWSAKAKQIGLWVFGFLILVGMIFIFIPHIKEEATHITQPSSTKQQKYVAPQAQIPVVREAEWEGGTPQSGVWSKTFQIPIGCSTRYDNGNGSKYRIRLRMYGEREWHDHVPGTYPNGNEIQFMLLQEGTGVPFTIKCS